MATDRFALRRFIRDLLDQPTIPKSSQLAALVSNVLDEANGRCGGPGVVGSIAITMLADGVISVGILADGRHPRRPELEAIYEAIKTHTVRVGCEAVSETPIVEVPRGR